MELVKPHKKYLASYIEALTEGFPIGGCSDDASFVKNNFEKHLSNLYRPREIWNDGEIRDDVPFQRLWIIEDDIFIGHMNLRVELNDFHEVLGGNIGYRVRTSFNGQGYATEALKQSLELCKLKKMNRVLVTCEEDNLASIRVIEKNNGKLLDKIKPNWCEKTIKRYLITV